MTKNIWVVANWKSNKTVQEALEWVAEVGSKIERRDDLKIVVCPTFVCIEEVKKEIMVGNFPIIVGSQDLSPFEEGAFTGEETAHVLREFVDVSILGHSERRSKFAETDEMILEKVERAKEHNITPLVCVQDENTPVPEGCKLVAYEPISAIGTGEPDSPTNASMVADKLKGKYGEELEVLYGGSVTPENVKSFVSEKNISGVLVGGASLDALEFVKIIKECSLI